MSIAICHHVQHSGGFFDSRSLKGMWKFGAVLSQDKEACWFGGQYETVCLEFSVLFYLDWASDKVNPNFFFFLSLFFFFLKYIENKTSK